MNDKNNNINRGKFFVYGIGFYSSNKEAVRKVRACAEQIASQLPEGTYTLRHKSPDKGTTTSGGSFGMAVEALRNFRKVRRSHWPQQRMLTLGTMTDKNGTKRTVIIERYTEKDGTAARRIFRPSAQQMLAENWEVIDG